MTKRDKLIERFKNNPKNVRYEEMETRLLHLGFCHRQNGTSHAVFVHTKYPTLRLTIPFLKPFIKKVYVEQALLAIQELDELID